MLAAKELEETDSHPLAATETRAGTMDSGEMEDELVQGYRSL
jgi:hypothetical protein